MATKSDFAQKLLKDLRLRKERMKASQSPTHSTPAAGDVYGKPRPAYEGPQQTRRLECIGSISADPQGRSNRGNRAASMETSTKQLIPFERGQNPENIGDMSMALAFALQNGGEINGVDSSNHSILSFLQQIGRRLPDNGKLEKNNFDMHQEASTKQLPILSHIHIKDVSRGAQKLNQILRACSNGLNFDAYSIEIGKELLKGAMDLEESLRMLANLQEASEYMTSPQRKTQIRLLEEDEEQEEKTDKISTQKHLELPIFSFDKPKRKSHSFREFAKADLDQKPTALTYPTEAHEALTTSNLKPHKRSASYNPLDFKSLSEFLEPKKPASLSQSKPEKKRISNVVAKLMGLEEFPENVKSKITMKESGSKEGEQMVSSRSAHAHRMDAEANTRETAKNLKPLNIEENTAQPTKTPVTGDATSILKAEKIRLTENANIKDVSPDEKSQRNNLERAGKINSVLDSRKTTIKPDQQHSITNGSNLINGSRNEYQQDKRQDNTKHKNQKSMERDEIKELLLKDELQHKATQKPKIPEAVNISQGKHGCKDNTVQTEKSNASRLLPVSQQMPQEGHELHQPHILRISEPQKEENRSEKREQQNAKKFPIRKQKEIEGESKNSSKPMHHAKSLRKQPPHVSQAAPSKRSSKTTNGTKPLKGLPNSRSKEGHVKFGSHSNTKVCTQNSMSGNSDQNASPTELRSEIEKIKGTIPLATEKKHARVQTKKKKVESAEVDEGETPQQIEKVMDSGNGPLHNLSRPSKHHVSILHETEQNKHGIIGDHKEADQLTASRLRDNKAEKVDTLYASEGDECQGPKGSCITSNDKVEDMNPELSGVSIDHECQAPPLCKDQAMNSEKILPSQLNRAKKSTEISDLQQNENKNFPTSGIRGLLTEKEILFKELLIKNQLFLSTAEALFKLNVPITILCGTDSNNGNQDQVSKVRLDCCYEIMKRKRRRQDIVDHPFLKVSVSYVIVSSLDDLVKQLYKDLERLRFYGRNESDEVDEADFLYKMLERDIQNRDPDVNSMWEFGWNKMILPILEKDDVIRDVERYLLDELVEEIIEDLLHNNISV